MIKHFKILIRGKVQGVFYRASTEAKAKELGVRGYVKNLEDGSVYLEAEAEEEILHNLVQWCKLGPPRASVSNVEVKESEPVHFTRFEVKR